MIITLVNGFYLATDSNAGAYSGSMTAEQQTNANIIRSFFLNEGWTLEAICGMLGNMQAESTMNPARIQNNNLYRLPNSGASLSDVPNSVMQNFYKEYYQVTRKAFGIGLVQWDGYSTRGGVNRQKLVAYCQDNNIAWWDGWSQLYRIRGEWVYDVDNATHAFFNPVTYSGVTYDFNNYPFSTASPETLAKAWAAGYERNAGGAGERPNTARMWYTYFTAPDAPAIILPEDFMQPTPDDPYYPPFDPDDPVDPDPSGEGYAPGWLVSVFAKKKGVLKKKWKMV